ncbi:VOC family protein [Mesobacillus zeae]|uniref:VOC family protein n=1 Tax=Mesobacillus zeae TaxID=1917180 RepID=A0A398BLX9_9BACI|nr:VOC family protein [Mesobacillus zeae]RID88770.1 VOC family protein [Mesobacillus zeae]
MNFHQKPNMFVESIFLQVQDLNRSVSFYTNILGFKVLKTSNDGVSLSADGKTEMIILQYNEGVREREARKTGLYHFALLLPERRHLGAFLAHMIKAGFPLQGASDHLVSEAIYIADPDGNGIEVYADRPADAWVWEEGEVEMSSLPLNAEELLSEGIGYEWSGMPEGTTIGHIHLHVSDLKEAEKFYCRTLGYEVVNRYGSQALFLSTGGYHHHIGLNTWNGAGAPAPSGESAGMKLFTIMLSDMDEREKVLERIRQSGASFTLDSQRILVHDPSGTQLALSVK